MATYTQANVEAATDRLGATWAQIVAMVATTEATNARTGSDTLIDDINALGLPKSLIMGAGAVSAQTALLAAGLKGLLAPAFTTEVRALNSDIGGFTAFAQNNAGMMYSSDFRDLCAALGITITATYVYKMTPQTLATFAATAATTGTFVGTGSLDTSLYGPVQCELYITNDIDSSTAVTLTMVKADATTEQKVVNLTTADDNTESVAVGTSTDVYTDVSAISITGGTSGDAFTVRTKALRAPAVS